MASVSGGFGRLSIWQAIEDLRVGRISPAESRKITKEVIDELRVIEAAMRAARLMRRIGGSAGRQMRSELRSRHETAPVGTIEPGLFRA
jgi:hypothetical protein